MQTASRIISFFSSNSYQIREWDFYLFLFSRIEHETYTIKVTKKLMQTPYALSRFFWFLYLGYFFLFFNKQPFFLSEHFKACQKFNQFHAQSLLVDNGLSINAPHKKLNNIKCSLFLTKCQKSNMIFEKCTALAGKWVVCVIVWKLLLFWYVQCCDKQWYGVPAKIGI